MQVIRTDFRLQQLLASYSRRHITCRHAMSQRYELGQAARALEGDLTRLRTDDDNACSQQFALDPGFLLIFAANFLVWCVRFFLSRRCADYVSRQRQRSDKSI